LLRSCYCLWWPRDSQDRDLAIAGVLNTELSIKRLIDYF